MGEKSVASRITDKGDANQVRTTGSRLSEEAHNRVNHQLDLGQLAQLSRIPESLPPLELTGDVDDPQKRDARSQRQLDGLKADENEQLRLMLSDITKYGEKPAHALGELMRKNQVVGIGDGHGPNEPLQIKARDYLQALRQGGATHLVIEAPQGCSEMLKEFNRSGKLDTSQLPILAQVPNYVEMLKTARALGLTVVAGDARQQPLLNEDEDRLSRIRNTYMADTIKEILDEPGQDPQHPNKVVFWVGALHLEDLHRENKGNLPTAAEILRSYHVKLATVTYQQGDKLDLVERAAATVSEPTMISTSKAKSIGDYVRKSGSVQNSWDHVIFYPAQR